MAAADTAAKRVFMRHFLSVRTGTTTVFAHLNPSKLHATTGESRGFGRNHTRTERGCTRLHGPPGLSGPVRGSAPRAPGSEPIQEAPEIQHVQERRLGALVAVGVAVARGEPIEEADEVKDVQARRLGALIAVGVTGRRDEGHLQPGPAGDDGILT